MKQNKRQRERRQKTQFKLKKRKEVSEEWTHALFFSLFKIGSFAPGTRVPGLGCAVWCVPFGSCFIPFHYNRTEHNTLHKPTLITRESSIISIKACVPYLSLKWRETKGKKLCPLFVHSTSLLCNVVKRKHERSEVNEQNKAHNTLEPRSVVCFLFVFLSLVSRFHSLRSFHCKRAKQRERERDTTVDDS